MMPSYFPVRPYTATEIDRMRAALVKRHPPHDTSFSGETVNEYDARAYRYNAMIEDKLRTYMLGGISPDELETTE